MQAANLFNNNLLVFSQWLPDFRFRTEDKIHQNIFLHVQKANWNKSDTGSLTKIAKFEAIFIKREVFSTYAETL